REDLIHRLPSPVARTGAAGLSPLRRAGRRVDEGAPAAAAAPLSFRAGSGSLGITCARPVGSIGSEAVERTSGGPMSDTKIQPRVGLHRSTKLVGAKFENPQGDALGK